ncbi:MAG: transcription termination/antitermination protein NusG [Tissierellia bacterium]|nr:transcription termination/antitermination protein NusG [Tissierellia bacterium]
MDKDNKLNEDNAKWYVVHTYSGYENKVKEKIESMIENGKAAGVFKAAVPMEEYEEIKGGKKVNKERKIFPGYVLIKMIIDPKNWFLIRNTRGVTGFVGPDSEPVALTKREIKEFGVENNQVISNAIKPEDLGFEVGDIINIVSGSFEGFEAEVKEINFEKGLVRATINMFGRDTAAEIDFNDIEKN